MAVCLLLLPKQGFQQKLLDIRRKLLKKKKLNNQISNFKKGEGVAIQKCFVLLQSMYRKKC